MIIVLKTEVLKFAAGVARLQNNDRVLDTAVNFCTVIEILNKVLIDLGIPTLADYFKYVVQKIKSEVLEDGEENYSDN